MEAAALWRATDPPWQAAFTEAWDSWVAGCWGIGAVVVGPNGSIVARGRNRILEQPSEPGLLAGTPLAHAELNALAQLPIGPLEGHELLTTLEPCLLCAGAIRLLNVPSVRFAAADPLFAGVHDHLGGHPYAAARQPRQEGPLDGPLAAFGALLPLTFLVLWQRHGPVHDVYRQANPELTVLAEELLDDRSLEGAAADGATLLDALELVWPRLPR